jgi:hypothetical protein
MKLVSLCDRCRKVEPIPTFNSEQERQKRIPTFTYCNDGVTRCSACYEATKKPVTAAA